MSFLKTIGTNPYVNIIIGLILCLSGFMEVLDSFKEGIKIGAHHGGFIFGLFHAIKTLPDIFEGAEHINKSTGKESKK